VLFYETSDATADHLLKGLEDLGFFREQVTNGAESCRDVTRLEFFVARVVLDCRFYFRDKNR